MPDCAHCIHNQEANGAELERLKARPDWPVFCFFFSPERLHLPRVPNLPKQCHLLRTSTFTHKPCGDIFHSTTDCEGPPADGLLGGSESNDDGEIGVPVPDS